MGPSPQPFNAAALKAVTEKAWQAQVVQAATLLRYRHFHPYDMRRSDTGWPDLTLVRVGPHPRTLYVELKRETGKATFAQVQWLDDLWNAGNEVHLWRPRDFDTVVATLQARSCPPDAPTLWPQVRAHTITTLSPKDRALLKAAA